ncbi:hypothetical protein T636_A1447 [Enterobacter hormaechei subsp. xiangfangensis]|nr:hypothetical protein T636_A1447 [Enterobacter hormaechei subsp. xiangfangensis]
MVQLPAHWYIDEATLRILGIVLLLIIAAYLWACAFAKRRHMTIKGQKLVLPSWKFAVLQMVVSSANWMAMGAIIWLLIGEDVNYFFVLGVLLVSSIAGVIVHIPAGIGVLEAVFIALLAGGCVRAIIAMPPAAGAGNGLLSGAGESGEEAAREEREGDGKIKAKRQLRCRFRVCSLSLWEGQGRASDSATLTNDGCRRYAAASGTG